MTHSYAPLAIRFATLEAVLSFFQDPPNVDILKLMAQHQGQLLSEMTKDKKATNDDVRDSEDKYPVKGEADYAGIQFDFSNTDECPKANRTRIFLTAHHLKDYVTRLVHRMQELHRANLSTHSHTFRILASDLNCYVQDLRNVSAEALVTLYFQIVNAKRCLDAHLAQSTSVPFTPTQLSKIADELSEFDDQIQSVMEVWGASNGGKVIEDSNKNDDINQTLKVHIAKAMSGSCDRQYTSPEPVSPVLQARRCPIASSSATLLPSTRSITPNIVSSLPRPIASSSATLLPSTRSITPNIVSSLPRPIASSSATLLPSTRSITPNIVSSLPRPIASSATSALVAEPSTDVHIRVEHAYAPSAVQYATLDKVVNFFQDPPHAESLMVRLRYGGRFSSHDSDTAGDKEIRHKGRLNYKGIQYDFSIKNQYSKRNCPRIFLAALFIKDRLKRLVEGTYDGIPGIRELHNANLTMSSRTFNNLASDLKGTPSLQGISTEALLTLYFQIVNAKRCLDAHLAQLKSASFKPTRMSEIADLLVGYDTKIQTAKEAWRAGNSAKEDTGNNNVHYPMKHLSESTMDNSRDEGSLSSITVSPAPQADTLPSAAPHLSTPPATPTKASVPSQLGQLPSPPGTSAPRPKEASGVSYDSIEQELLRLQNEQADVEAMHRMQQGSMLAEIKSYLDDVEATNKKQQDEMMALIQLQQSTIKALALKINILESDFSKSNDCQLQLEQRVLKLTEQNNVQQVSISRLDIGLEGTTNRTIKHDVQIKGLESRMS
ncbi:hypothetical protein MVEG_00076 [Podila verticillata NRRL 6337]|nr:hypothetical protein MVEG_00076 [Podila verticillata NRRL 6337]